MKTRSFNSMKDLNVNSSFFQEMSEFMTNPGAEKSPKMEHVPKVGSVHSSRSGQ
jgi:hypothetical protein